MNIKMQSQKSTRRKRKDPQSRDFTCQCGKTYLSYAAAYTHVKNKHQLEKQFLDGIHRPTREKLPRGRPKDQKHFFTNKDSQRLSVIESAILKMYELLHGHFPQMILQGNAISPPEKFEQAQKLLLGSSEHGNQQLSQGTCEDYQFISDLNRHFVAEIAAKVKFIVLSIASEAQNSTKSEEEQHYAIILDNLNSYNLWQGVSGVNELILDTYSKCKSLKGE